MKEEDAKGEDDNSKSHDKGYEEGQSVRSRDEASGDEEISLDLTKIKAKIKGLFASGAESGSVKERKHSGGAGNAGEQLDRPDAGEHVSEDGKEEDAEISLDMSSIAGFFRKNSIFLLLLLPIFLSVFFRVYPAYLPVTDSWAQGSVNSYLQGQISGQIAQQYPNLPEANRQALVQKELEKIYEAQGTEIMQQIEDTSQYFKSRLQDENGHTYLLAIDPYLWYSLAKNYIEDPSTGLGDRKNDRGENWFSLRNGRFGKGTTPLKLVPGFNVLLYKFLKIINRDITLMRAVFFVPVVLIALSIIPAFFIARRIAGNTAGVFAGIIIAINTALLGRTPAGFADSDPYNILWPLFIVWSFILSFDTKDYRRSLLFGSITGMLFGLYSISWLGWGHLFIILIVTVGLSTFYYAIINREKLLKRPSGFLGIGEIRNNLAAGLSMAVSTMVFVTIFRGFGTFIGAADNVLSFIRLKEVAVTTLWPNVLTTVAEFNVVGLKNIISQMGGNLFFLIALSGLFLAIVFRSFSISGSRSFLTFSLVGALSWNTLVVILLLNYQLSISMLMLLLSVPFFFMYFYTMIYRKRGYSIEYGVLLIVWFVATLYSFTKGMRFAILLVPSFAVGFGITIGWLYTNLSRMLDRGFKVDPAISKIVVIILFSLLLINPLRSADAVAKNELPSMNDAWHSSLTGIRDASEDAIITSWWDFGHWFYAISERRVTFDGADQGRRIHWVGKSLLESDEDLAVGILRMLNCGQEESFRVYNKNYNHLDEYDPKEPNTFWTIRLMNRVMRESNRTAAKSILLDAGFSEEEAEESLDYTHCDNLIDQYYIASEDMIGKSGVWAHFGSWNFTRAAMWQGASKIKQPETGIEMLMRDFELDRDEAEQVYYEVQSTPADRWVSEWPSYASGVTGCTKSGSKLSCANGLSVELDKMNATLNSASGPVQVHSLVYPEGERLVTREFENGYPISAVLIPKGDGGYNSLLSSPELAASMFTRLFFLKGHGLRHFRLFSYKQGVTGEDIYVYKVEWEPQQPSIMPESVAPEEIRASHILVNSSEEAEEIIRLLEQGEDFEKMARERSIGPTGPAGGDLGWFSRGTMVPEFENAAFSMETGEFSAEPVKTQFGYHIIKVTGKKGGREEPGPEA